jgi:hypothetical protein
MSTIDSFGKVFYPDCNKDTIHGAKLFSINKEVFIEFDYPTYKLPRKPDIILGEFTGLGPVTCMDNELFGFQSGQGGNLCKYKVTYLPDYIFLQKS